MFPISSRIVNSIRPVCASQLLTVVSVGSQRGFAAMPGFVGCYTSPAYPEGSELVDLAKAGYCAFAPVVSEMSYGCIKSGLVLPWKVSADAHIRELVKLLGNKKVSDILI